MARAKDQEEGKGKAAASSDGESEGEYGVDRSRAGRDRKTTGTSKEKARGFEKLKQSRAQKGNKDKKVSTQWLLSSESSDRTPLTLICHPPSAPRAARRRRRLRRRPAPSVQL